MRRLALLASVLTAVAATGTASGSLDRTPRDVIEQALTKVPELRGLYEGDDAVRELIDTARKVEGIARHASTHATTRV